MFPREPSPAGDLQLDPEALHEIPNPSFEAALDLMLRARAGDIIHLVCHAFEGGIFLRLAGDASPIITPSTISMFQQVDKAEAEAVPIRAMPQATDEERRLKAARWANLYNSLFPGAVTGEVPLAEVQALYDKWLREMLNSNRPNVGLHVGSLAVFQRLNTKIKRVRALNFERLELRACNLGGNLDTMRAVKGFLGCQKLLAPTVHTFFNFSAGLETLNQILAPANPRARRIDVLGAARVPGPLNGPVRARGLAGHTRVNRINWPELLHRVNGHHTRQFLLLEPQPTTGGQPDVSMTIGNMIIGGVVVVRLDPIPNTTRYITDLAVFTDNLDGRVDPARVTRFLQSCVMPAATWQRGRIPLAGLVTDGVSNGFDVIWPDTTHGQAALGPFVFPNEPKYLELIAQV
jgi:hypothetical protein